MLLFECPSCKTKWRTDDENGGKPVVCPKCEATVSAGAGAISAVAPVSLPPLTAVTTPELADAAQAAKSKWHDDDVERDTFSIAKDGGATRSWLSNLGCALIGIGVLAICVCLVVPATSKVRDAAARTQSINNLKNIVLAMHSFHDANRRLPFNGTGPAVGGIDDSGSWAFQILPYIDQAPMYHNPEAARNVGIAAFMCPIRARTLFENNGGPWTDYFYNNYLNDPKQASKPNNIDMKRMMKDITDGSSNTIFVGHGNIRTTEYNSTANVTMSVNIFIGGTTGTMRAGNNGESNPTGVTLERDSDKAPTIGSWGGPFPQGAWMGLGDGTVRMFPYTMQNFGAFLTPTGNEVVILPD